MVVPISHFLSQTACCAGKCPDLQDASDCCWRFGIDLVLFITSLVLAILGATSVINMGPIATYALFIASGAIPLLYFLNIAKSCYDKRHSSSDEFYEPVDPDPEVDVKEFM